MTLKEKIEKLEKQKQDLERAFKEASENLVSSMSNYYKEPEAEKALHRIIKINILHNIIVMLKSKKRS